MTAPNGLPAGANWQGNWLVGTTYAVADVVTTSPGNYFIAHAISTGVAPPSDGMSASNAAWERINLGSPAYTLATGGTPVNAVAATQTVTASGSPADGNTVTVNGRVYTYKTALSTGPAVPYEVLIGADVTAAALNLTRAIMAGAGAGTLYGTGTVVHPTVSSTASVGVATLAAKTKGAAGNQLTLAKVGANLAVGGAVLAGGVDGTETNGSYITADGSYLYVAHGVNTVSDANWLRAALSSF